MNDSIRIATAAKEENIEIAFEFHKNTLTDTNESCLELLKRVNEVNVKSYWQPSQDMNVEERISGLEAVLPLLSHIHVFHWGNGEKFPLAQGLNEWKQYMDVIKKAEGDRYAMLEFVRDNSIEQFFDDAATLKEIIS